MVADPHRLFMSVEEYLALDSSSPDARYEFIDGIVTMLAGGTINHSRISVNLIVALDGLLRGKSCMVCNSDMRLEISATRYVYPDISVSCDPRDQEQGDRDSIQYPCIVFEVLSASTEAYDRGRKFDYYRACPTLREYVLVDTQQQAIDLYRRQTENLWTFHPFRSGDEVELKSINVHFPIDSVYQNVSFPVDIF
ncbi:MAG TPA: Uma2 family endonuclease [Ktedonobacteraceae bacterium]|nr:Uma2 family endonuclease [Ktedonobacteraceae bacterium]